MHTQANDEKELYCSGKIVWQYNKTRQVLSAHHFGKCYIVSHDGNYRKLEVSNRGFLADNVVIYFQQSGLTIGQALEAAELYAKAPNKLKSFLLSKII